MLYLYAANLLTKNLKELQKTPEVDPMQLKDTMERLVTSLLLPLSFFMFARRLLGTIVSEKEQGMLEYLKINGTR